MLTNHTIADWHCHNIFLTAGLFVSIGPLVCFGKIYVCSVCTSNYRPEFLLIAILTKSNASPLFVTGKLYFPFRYERLRGRKENANLYAFCGIILVCFRI